MAQTNQNGARAKILRALIINGMLTIEELAQQTGLTAGQARDNANAAVVSRLVVKGKDCVTGLLGYQITPLGRLWNDGQLQNAGATSSETAGSETAQPAPETGPEQVAEISEEMRAYVTADVEETYSRVQAEIDKAYTIGIHHIDVTEPAQPPEQYAFFRLGGSAWLRRAIDAESLPDTA